MLRSVYGPHHTNQLDFEARFSVFFSGFLVAFPLFVLITPQFFLRSVALEKTKQDATGGNN